MSWTAITRNTRLEDDPVLRVIPYFADDDKEGIDITLYDQDATRVSLSLSLSLSLSVCLCLSPSPPSFSVPAYLSHKDTLKRSRTRTHARRS